MAIWDNFKNALRPYDDDDYIENEASEEETAAFEDIPEPAPAYGEEYSEPKAKTSVFAKKEHSPLPLLPPLTKRRERGSCL